MAIVSIAHKGLRRLFEDDDARGVGPLAGRLKDMLLALDTAATLDDLKAVPGWRLHPLRHDLLGYWSLSVTKSWRLTFRFEDGDVSDLDLTLHYLN
jgi:proteic killer suppression protein